MDLFSHLIPPNFKPLAIGQSKSTCCISGDNYPNAGVVNCRVLQSLLRFSLRSFGEERFLSCPLGIEGNARRSCETCPRFATRRCARSGSNGRALKWGGEVGNVYGVVERFPLKSMEYESFARCFTLAPFLLVIHTSASRRIAERGTERRDPRERQLSPAGLSI